MEFILGGDFSYELTHNKYREPLEKIENALNMHFQSKDYGEKVIKISCGIICVSQDFEQFFVVRPAKLLRKEPIIEFEYKLDFNTYKSMDIEQREKYIISEYLKNIKVFFASKKIKDFDSENFVKDLESYFSLYGIE